MRSPPTRSGSSPKSAHARFHSLSLSLPSPSSSKTAMSFLMRSSLHWLPNSSLSSATETGSLSPWPASLSASAALDWSALAPASILKRQPKWSGAGNRKDRRAACQIRPGGPFCPALGRPYQLIQRPIRTRTATHQQQHNCSRCTPRHTADSTLTAHLGGGSSAGRSRLCYGFPYPRGWFDLSVISADET